MRSLRRWRPRFIEVVEDEPQRGFARLSLVLLARAGELAAHGALEARRGDAHEVHTGRAERIARGPAVGDVLKRLRRMQLDGGISSRDEALAIARAAAG